MKTQHPFYAQVQDWLQTEDEPSDTQLAELEKSFQDWNKQFNDSSLDWDWELNLFKGEPQENPDDWYSDTEDDEDLYEEDEYPYDLY